MNLGSLLDFLFLQVVFKVAVDNMVDQWTVSRKEQGANVHSLSMKSFAVTLLDIRTLFLHKEAHLSPNAEVRDCDEHDLLKHGVLAQLMSIL